MSLELLEQASNKNTILFGSMFTKRKQMGNESSCEWRCNLCNNGKIYKGSYTRVKAHIFHEWVKGVDVHAHTRNTEVGAKFDKENNDAQKLKEQRSNIGRNNC
jgi:hypothetical protein